MDWLKGMNGVITEIEKKLTEPIELEWLARTASCSVHEFSRIFSYMAGISVSEYIRRRRLSCAALDIRNGDDKIINIAYKYCYDSPSSFTRAFKELHGVAPLSVRKASTKFKTFPTIKFNLTIEGAEVMNYTIVQKEAFRVVGKRFAFSYTGYREDIDWNEKVWQNLTAEDTEILKKVADEEGILGIYMMEYLNKCQYLIGVRSQKPVPEGFEAYIVPAARWALLVNENNSDLHRRFRTDWLPSTVYKRENSFYPTIEYYEDTNITANSYTQCWKPICSTEDFERKRAVADAELAKLEAQPPRGKTVEIDLSTLTPHEGAKKKIWQKYDEDGNLVIHTMIGDGRMATPQNFTFPIKIEMCAKTDETNMRLYYGENSLARHGAWVIFHSNDEHNSVGICNLSPSNEHWFDGVGRLPKNEFVDIEWILGEKVLAVKVNNQIRVVSCEFDYIEAVKNGFTVTGPVYAAAGRGSTITIKSLKVTEL